MLTAAKDAQDLLSKNAELLARLKLAEEKNQQLQRSQSELQGRVAELQTVKQLLEEEVRWFKLQFFGRSSEKHVDAAVASVQRLLFNEAEVLSAIEAAEVAHANRTTNVAAHERKTHTGGRQEIPEHLPRQDILHDLKTAEKWCEHDTTCWQMERIGEETSERYHIERPKVWIERHIRPKYCCPKCHEGVRIAAVAPTLLPKSSASPSILAYFIAGKFIDGMPLYRSCQQLKRLDVHFNPGTVGTWVNIAGTEAVQPLINLMSEEMLRMPFIHMDETHLQVLRSDKAPASKHCMVVRAAGPPGRKIVLFNYEPSRTVEALKALLIGAEGAYRGKLLTDGLEHYDSVTSALKVLHFACLAHCRRYYDKAMKVTETPSGRSLAKVALEDYIRPLYKVEKDLKELRKARMQQGQTLTLQEVLQARQDRSKPLTQAFKAWIDTLLPGTPPSTALGKALSYSTNQWEKLVRYLDHPEVPIDNNDCENEIRPFVVGRKGWLFAHNPLGARASANLYSLVSTAKGCGVEPYAYLEYLFERLPLARGVEDLEALLPWNVKPLLKAAA